jgi:hypothetical protein
MRALECDQPCVLLIDELDKVDEGFDAQALKRACSCFGLGRCLYRFGETRVRLNSRGEPLAIPILPEWALPPGMTLAQAKITYDIFRTFDFGFILWMLVQAGGARPLRQERWSHPWKRDWSRLAG